MRAFWLFMIGCTLSASAFGAVYKHVDQAGTVTYSDRPQQPDQEARRLPPPNVATPEARRQLEIARQRFEREERAEHEARIRRAAAVQRPAPAASLRPRTPAFSQYAPRYASPVYYAVYARTTSQSNPPQRLRPAAVPHWTGNARH